MVKDVPPESCWMPVHVAWSDAMHAVAAAEKDACVPPICVPPHCPSLYDQLASSVSAPRTIGTVLLIVVVVV